LTVTPRTPARTRDYFLFCLLVDAPHPLRQ
jgi:hypothetical protein